MPTNWEIRQLWAANYWKGRQDGLAGTHKGPGAIGYHEGYDDGSSQRFAWERSKPPRISPEPEPSKAPLLTYQEKGALMVYTFLSSYSHRMIQ